MITKPLHAWVLNKRWSGDTSAQVTFFTREQGIIRGLCKGGRTPKKQSLLQAFIPLWIVVDTRREWYYIRQLEIIAPSLPLKGSALFAGLYMNELLHHLLRPCDEHPELYDAYTQTLDILNTCTHPLQLEETLRRFEIALLTSCGYQMLLTHDVDDLPIDASKYYSYTAGNGFTIANKGINGAHILAFAEDKLNDIGVLKSAKWIMRRAIDHAVDGKPIKARELYALR